MENAYEELVENIIYVEEDTNPTFTFINLGEEIPEVVKVVSQPIPKVDYVAKDYICGSCDDAFAERKELEAHLRTKHPEIYHVVSSFKKSKEQATDKVVVDTPLTNKIEVIDSCYTCKCGEHFAKFVELEQHVQIKHSEEFETVPDTGDDDGIEYCEEQLSNSHDMIDEEIIQNVENESAPAEKTTDCENIVSSHNQLQVTSYVTIDELISKGLASGTDGKNTRGPHICEICGAKFSLKAQFNEHMKEKHPGNPQYICDICSNAFHDIIQLRKHKQGHNEKRFVCDICSKGFSTKTKLTVHLDIHFRRNTVDCEICGKTFAAKSGYRVHMKKHLGMWYKNIECEICNARFRYQYNLDVHMKSHLGQKDYICEICNKGFALQRQLQVHLDSHNGLRRFSCDTCGQKFIRRQTWRRHLITHTGEKAYKCEMCDAAYVDRRSLRKHLEKMHPGSNIEAYSKPVNTVPVIVEDRQTDTIMYEMHV